MKTQLIFVLTLMFGADLFCQTATQPDFLSPVEVCLNEPASFNDESSNAAYVEWDFCDKDFDGPSSVKSSGSLIGLGRVLGLDLVRYDGYWYGFATSWDQNKLYRLRFGYGIKEPPTEIVDLGNPSNLLNQPVSVKVVYRASKWYLLVHNWGSGAISRVDMGSDLTASPQSSVNVVTGVGGFPAKMDVIDTGERLQAGVIQSNGSIRIVDFKNNPELAVLASDVVSTPSISGVSGARDLTFVKHNSNWLAFVSTFNTSTIFRVEFGSDIKQGTVNPPVSVIGPAFGGRINNIAVTQSGSGYYLHLLTLEGGLFKINLPDINSLPTEDNIIQYGQAVSYNEGYVLKFIKDQGQWTGFTLQDNLGTSPRLHIISSEFDCGESLKFSTDVSPIVTYDRPGIYPVTLSAISPLGFPTTLSKELSVKNVYAPQVDFVTTSICQSSPASFVASSDQDIGSYDWSFGDAATSTSISPVHQYSSTGTYSVHLDVVGSNGCKNSIIKQIQIFDPPVPDFILPSGMLCTNNAFTFSGTTPDTYVGHLSYEWYVNNDLAGVDRNLDYVFLETGAQEISLVTSIPGCSAEISKFTPLVGAGPRVDFSVSGSCENEMFSFKSEIFDTVISKTWHFLDGQTSAEPDLEVSFPEAGSYMVSLSATNSLGCESVETKAIVVHSKPLVDFTTEGPPNACSNQSTDFENQTKNPDGRQITGWLWEFNDPLNPETANTSDVTRTFADPGTYSVSLTATTEGGCVDTVEKDITIFQSPSVAYTHPPACEDIPVSFSPPADNSIAYWYWEIGTAYYYAPTPSHTFMAPGDYPLYAEFVGANGCVSEISKTIHVPQPLIPDFSFIKNCVGQEALFTDLTAGSDPVASREWDFGNGESSSSSPASHVFSLTGAWTVVLKVTGQSGCDYQVARPVEVSPPPQAAFTASPQSGASPLEVAFTNSSSQATTFFWEFMDGTGTISEEESPNYTFSEQGSFDVRLTAYNAQQCEDNFTRTITTLAPLPDADVEMINVVPNPDGSARLIVTINNKGNTILKSLPLTVDFGGKLSLQQIVDEAILPATRVNFVFTTSILDTEMLRYLCVSLDLDHDLNPTGNRMCKQFESRLFAFPAYPNPAGDQLEIEWISESNINVHISLIDGLGRQVFFRVLPSVQGLNRHRLSLEGLGNGIYFLAIDDGVTRASQRIVVVNAP